MFDFHDRRCLIIRGTSLVAGIHASLLCSLPPLSLVALARSPCCPAVAVYDQGQPHEGHGPPRAHHAGESNRLRHRSAREGNALYAPPSKHV